MTTLKPVRRWDTQQSNSNMIVSASGYSVRCIAPSYFNSAIGEGAMTAGSLYYFEVKVWKQKVGGLLQVGVTQKQNLESAYFSSTKKGWGFYPSWGGLIEHDGQKQSYGCKLLGSGLIGVYVDLVKGKIAFSVNGNYLGVAYNLSKSEMKEPFFPAFATCDSQLVCSFVIKYWSERLPLLFCHVRVRSLAKISNGLLREICFLIA